MSHSIGTPSVWGDQTKLCIYAFSAGKVVEMGHHSAKLDGSCVAECLLWDRYVIWATIVTLCCLWCALRIAWCAHALALNPYNTLKKRKHIYISGRWHRGHTQSFLKKGGLLRCSRQKNRICAQVFSARNIFTCCTFTAIVQMCCAYLCTCAHIIYIYKYEA